MHINLKQMLPEDWALYTEIATRMDDRLDAVKMMPSSILCLGADFNQSLVLLSKRYPKKAIQEIDPDTIFLNAAESLRRDSQNIWQKFRSSKTPQVKQNLEEVKVTEPADMIWSNLSLHTNQNLQAAFASWSEALNPEGMLFLSSFGPDTLIEIRNFLINHGINLQTNRLWDMHDLGDMLFYNGFAEPVMDMEKITISYKSPKSFWRDIRMMRLLHTVQIPKEQRFKAMRLINQALKNGQLTNLTLEVIYGHALKKIKVPEGENIVTFYPKKPS